MIRQHSPNYRREADAAIYGENVLTRNVAICCRRTALPGQ
jgi:hypothetical protein